MLPQSSRNRSVLSLQRQISSWPRKSIVAPVAGRPIADHVAERPIADHVAEMPIADHVEERPCAALMEGPQ
jgi:hypothetical protein